MFCAKDYADKLLEELWPAVMDGVTDGGERADAALKRIGCNHDILTLVKRMLGWRRDIRVPDDLRVSARQLKKLLCDLGEHCTKVGDWPYDYIDPGAKLYHASWVTSERYHWWLCCLYLVGGDVPGDVWVDLARMGIRSTLRNRAQGASLLARLGCVPGAAFDA